MSKISKEMEMMIVSSIANIHERFVNRLESTIEFSEERLQRAGIFSFLKPDKKHSKFKIKTETTIAFFCLLKESLSELHERGEITPDSRDQLIQIACIYCISTMTSEGADKKQVMLLMQERLESTYVVLSYGDLISSDERQQIILRCVGDVLRGIDSSLGSPENMQKKMDKFHEDWKIGLELKILSGMAS